MTERHAMLHAMLWSLVALVGVLVTLAAPARCQPLPRDRGTRLVLAQAMVAEAGWRADRDHAGIAHVLGRRWRTRPALASLSFGEVVRRYCAAWRTKRRRATWVRALSTPAARPMGWPRQASWRAHAPLWRQVLRRAERFLLGQLADPCRGRASHWGSPQDVPGPRMRRVNCGPTLNRYYMVMR